MTLEEKIKDIEFELWNAIGEWISLPKVITTELQEAHMHIRKAMKILQIQRRME